MQFAKFVLQSAARKLAQTALSLRGKRLPAPVTTALYGSVWARLTDSFTLLAGSSRPAFISGAPLSNEQQSAVGVATNIQPRCEPVKSYRTALCCLGFVSKTGIPSAGPFFLKRGEVFE